jgi:hypothetical protein
MRTIDTLRSLGEVGTDENANSGFEMLRLEAFPFLKSCRLMSESGQLARNEDDFVRSDRGQRNAI